VVSRRMILVQEPASGNVGFLHLRCKVSDPYVVEMFEPLLEEPKLISLDHTPEQWHDIDKCRTFHRGRTEASEQEFQALIER
jgi:alpha-D-ribose 1-methylphosphonate 5-triphosphate diphosphatase PhnM